MKNCTGFICIMFLLSMIALAAVEAADAQSEEKESEPATSVSKEEASDQDGVITNSVGMKLKLIKAGEFMMGSSLSPEEIAKRYGEKALWYDWEKPVHKVKITRPFYIGVYEVTRAQYEKIMGKNPSKSKGPNRPVDSITWDDAVLFCKKLSEKEGVEYRLPTEAEWEYACRAGTRTKYYWGDEMDGRYAWYNINSERKTHDVGHKKPNAWGLYDMSGNVFERCSDWFARDYYDNSPEKDPQGPKDGKFRVLRGGSWDLNQAFCRSEDRVGNIPGRTWGMIGFRIVRAPE